MLSVSCSITDLSFYILHAFMLDKMLIIFSLIVLIAAGYALRYLPERKTVHRLYTFTQLLSHRASNKSQITTSNTQAVPILVDTFPPSLSHALPDFVRHKGSRYGFQIKLLPDKQPADPKIHHNHTTPTGMTLRDIQQLGDFPDYATLSGVPLPDPYPEFDIAKAMPRPYRPFRWSYHQTMCKWAL